MKRSVATVIAAALAISACGAGKSAATNSAAQAGITTAEKVVKRCVPNPLAMTSSSARKAAMACAVPPGKEQQVASCVEKGVLTGIPTKTRIEKVLVGCVQKAGV